MIYLAAGVIVSMQVVADPLSSADREALLENLEKLRNSVTERVDARFRLAINAYRTAMMDEGAALEFYLQCIEKLNFEDQGRKASEFREWKKREDDKMSEATMRRALMHQLRWLVLSLRASSENADMEQLTKEGQDAMDAVFRDAAMLASQREILGQGVTGTVFARVYGVNDVKLEKWPASPIDVGGFYEGLVFPRLRLLGDVNGLRQAWLNRIQREQVLREAAPSRPRGPNGRGGPEPEPERGESRFATQVLPDMMWQMEMDLFRCGDQKGAATRMVAHLEKYITHDKAKAWSDQLKGLISGPQPAQVAP